MHGTFSVGGLLICVVQELLFIGYVVANWHKVLTIEGFEPLECLDDVTVEAVATLANRDTSGGECPLAGY